ncbi:helix-turn-helix domain-containing protein [Actinoplanes sp. NPDC049599]|uniref:helix-turn-helix domain-containing protein n=1 Tax=Actinoplanes sp. NPDC049599 TaxID=3363903 RepID=UPI0037A130E7
MINSEDLADVILLGHELDSIEFKGPGDLSDKAFLAKVARACLGMSNRRDGGMVIIGVEDKNPSASVGLNESQIGDWLDFDNVADALHRYADPAIRFELAQRNLPGGAAVVVIEVIEFEEIPILCRRDYTGTLVTGALYVRNRHKPQTTPFPTHEDMRRLLDLATEKGVRRFLEQAERAGFAPPSASTTTDLGLYAEQLGGFA